MSSESVTIAQDIPAPRRCFCHLPTIQLLGTAKEGREKEAVGIVALIDVPDDDVIHLLSPLAQPGCRILACRDYVKRWLTDMLAMHQASREATP